MANIGNLNFKISAVADGALKTLKATSSAIGTFASNTAAVASKVNKSLSGMVNATGFGSFSKGLGGSLATVFGGVGKAIVGGIGLSPSFFKEQIDKISALAETGIKAKSIGVLSDDFMALSNNAKRFGLEGDDLLKVLFKFGANGDKVLGGVDPEKWAGADVMGRLRLLADKVSELPPGFKQMEIASEAFGAKMGFKMLPVLQQGAKGIDEFAAKQKALGLAVSQADMDKVIRAKQAMPKFKAVFEGFETKMTVASAPVIEMFANQMTKFMPIITTVVDGAARAVAVWFTVMGEFWSTAFKYVGEVADRIFVSSGAIEGLETNFGTIEDVVKRVLRGIAYGFAYVFDTVKAGSGAMMAALGPAFAAVGKVGEELGAKWGKRVQKLGVAMTAWGVDNVRNWGETADSIDGFFARAFARNDAFVAGAKAGAAEIKGAYQGVAAMTFGSKEAISVEARFKTEGMKDPAQVAKENAKAALAEQQRANALLARVAKAVEDANWRAQFEKRVAEKLAVID